MATQTFDEVKAEAFGGQLMTVLNNSCTALFLSVGYQTGLLETLAGLPPATSERTAGSGCARDTAGR